MHLNTDYLSKGGNTSLTEEFKNIAGIHQIQMPLLVATDFQFL